MRPVCKFYKASECLNPRCRFSHPVEYPVYIYTTPGVDIHPDELRAGVMYNPDMCREADNVWINNYMLFCQTRGDEYEIDIVERPDYFCMPFDVKRVSAEIDRMKKEQQMPKGGYASKFDSQGGYRDDGRGDRRQGGGYYDNRYERSDSSRYDSKPDRRYDNRQGARPDPGRADRPGGRPQGSWHGQDRADSRPQGGWYGQDRPERVDRPDSRPQGGWYGQDKRGGDGQEQRQRWGAPQGRNYRQEAVSPAGWNESKSAEAPASGGWYGKGGQPAQGSFDRPKGAQSQDSSQDTVPEYEYHNVPYSYK